MQINFKKLSHYFTGLNIIIALVAINVIFSFFPFWKIDLTKNRVHTLSPATRNIIKNLDDVVNVKVYISNELPSQVKPLAYSMRSILEEFRRINNKFVVEYVDPSKNDEVKTEAMKIGIQPLQFSSVKNDKLEVSNGYFVMKISYGDKQEVMPIVGDIGNLEYFLVSSINKLISKELPKVVIIGGSQGASGSETSLFEKYLSNNYVVVKRGIGDSSEIGEDVDLVVITGVKTKIEDKALEKILSYLSKNKPAVIFDGKYGVGDALQATRLPESGLEKWLKEKGITVEAKLVADSSSTIASFRNGNSSFFSQYPYWITVRQENINHNLPATSGVNTLMMPWNSSIVVEGKAQSLLTSTEMSVAPDNGGDISPMSKIDFNKTSGSKYPLAAINIEDAKVAVVGSSDFIKDQFVQNSQQNLIFALNLVDYLSNDSTLLSIRSKTLTSYPLIQTDDKLKQIIKTVNIGLPIFILGLLAIAANISRKKLNKRWEE